MAMTINDIRVENARWLCEHEAGGVLSEFGRRVGATNRQQVSNWIGKTPVRNISSETARQIEQSFGRPTGWLDERHVVASQAARSDSITISRMDGPGPLGRGRLPMLAESTITQLGVSREWLRRNAGARAPEFLVVATVTGDAMHKTLPEGTLVLVDRSVSIVADDGVYMLSRSDGVADSSTWFRRVSRGIDGLLHVTAENQAIKDQAFKTMKEARLLVLGRVVVALEVRRL